ncbi:MAG: zinc carboxypeptidase, partial [Bacteroidetes bacterium]
SQQRLKIYNMWMPHIHVDYHEQGINEPYFFAPATEPFHEVISDFQRNFQVEIGKNHAKYFDKAGWLFFTRERFDLLYPSYGDTYPTFMGAIGMTYEQAGHSRGGLGIDNDEGFELTLMDRVAHHTTTGLSTVEIASRNAAKLNTEFKKFFQNGDLKYKSYILKGHPDKIDALTKLLDKHEIKYGFSNGGNVNGYSYTENGYGRMNANGALVVSTNQPKGKMVKVLFEPDTKLSDPLTYDITAWSVPYAYGLDCIASTSLVRANGSSPVVREVNQVFQNAAGYLVSWNSMYDATFLSDLLQNDIRVRFSEKDLSFNGKKFNKGSLVITRSDNIDNPQFAATLTKLANKHGRSLYITTTSFSDNRTDFGSPDIKLVHKTRIAVLKGKGTSSLSYGAIWHFFETQLKYPVTSIDTDNFNTRVLKNFDVLIMPGGRYSDFANDNSLKDLKTWIRSGGKVIAMGRAVNTFNDKEGFDVKRVKEDSSNTADDKDDDSSITSGSNDEKLIPYDKRERERVKNNISGSIYKVTLDPSHPMAFGFGDTYYSLKLGSSSYQFLEHGYNVGYIKDDAISVSGFSGDDAKAKLKNSMIFGEARMGSGSIVYLVDDVLFRSFWENGKLLFVNSLFFVNSNAVRL